MIGRIRLIRAMPSRMHSQEELLQMVIPVEDLSRPFREITRIRLSHLEATSTTATRQWLCMRTTTSTGSRESTFTPRLSPNLIYKWVDITLVQILMAPATPNWITLLRNSRRFKRMANLKDLCLTLRPCWAIPAHKSTPQSRTKTTWTLETLRTKLRIWIRLLIIRPTLLWFPETTSTSLTPAEEIWWTSRWVTRNCTIKTVHSHLKTTKNCTSIFLINWS